MAIKKRQDDDNAGPDTDTPVAAESVVATGRIGRIVTLRWSHTHAGRIYVAGDSISVSDAEFAWLRDNDLIES